MSTLPDSTAKVTDITPCGEGKVCITLEVIVDAHRLVEISGQMLSAAVKGASAKKAK